MRRHVITFALVGIFVSAASVDAAMSSTNYQIRWDTVSSGGSDTAASSDYGLRDTFELGSAGFVSSSSYQIKEGYRTGIVDQFIAFEVWAQNSDLGQPALALSDRTVLVQTTSGFSVNDLIVLVQDQGASQVAAMGRIISIGSGSVTVDVWKDGGVAPIIDGTGDYIFPLTGTNVSLGQLSTTVRTSIIGFEVGVDNDDGYAVQIFEDGNLRSGSDAIDDVLDGHVTTAFEEYGARSSDTTISSSTFDTADTAITTTPTDVATESVGISQSRNFLTLKVAIHSSTSPGVYSQVLSIIVSGNF